MTALISKPGITSASTLSIPKSWDITWFRNFIQNQLKGADVRNALAGPGISISGNISTPYATIGVGGVGAKYPIILNPPAATYALQIDGTTYAGISLNPSGLTGLTGDTYFFANNATDSYIGTRSTAALHIQTNSLDRI